MPSVHGVHETIIYAADLDAAVRFYADVLGLTPLSESVGAAGRGLRLASGAVLLIFDPERSIRSGRGVPAHGAIGPCHVAFAIGEDSCDAWLARLGEHGVEVEQETVWPGGSRSIYFRDPDGNSVELMAGDSWAHVQGG